MEATYTEGVLESTEGVTISTEGVLESTEGVTISAEGVNEPTTNTTPSANGEGGTAALGTVANIRANLEQSGDSSTPASRREFGSQDEIDSPHIGALKAAIASFNPQKIDNMAKKSMWTKDTILDTQKFRNPLHYLIDSYITASETDTNQNLQQGFSECLAVLLSHDLNINEGDIARNTPLHLLCHHCGVDGIMKCLLASGSKVNIGNANNQTALHLATDNGTAKDVETLLEGGADPNQLDSTGLGPLHNAVKYRRNRDTIKYLVGCGAIVDLQQVEGKKRTGPTPLHIAVRQNRAENVCLLLELGAQADVKDSSGQTPIHLAAKYDISGDMVRYLIQGGAYMDCRDSIYEETPLHKAIKKNMVENVKVLIQAGASLSKPDATGNSVMHTAAACCHNIEIWVSLMNSKHVDIKLRNAKGKTVLEYASRVSNKLAVNVLKQIEG